MPAVPTEWTYNYAVLARLTGLTEEAVRQHRHRERFDPDKLESVLVYIAEYGEPELQQEIVTAALQGRRTSTDRRTAAHGKRTKRA